MAFSFGAHRLRDCLSASVMSVKSGCRNVRLCSRTRVVRLFLLVPLECKSRGGNVLILYYGYAALTRDDDLQRLLLFRLFGESCTERYLACISTVDFTMYTNKSPGSD